MLLKDLANSAGSFIPQCPYPSGYQQPRLHVERDNGISQFALFNG